MKLKTDIDSLRFAGYTAKKYLKRVAPVIKCILRVPQTWKIQIMNNLIILNRGGFTNFSPYLACHAFAVLNATKNVLINQSKLTSRNAAKDALSYMMGC